MSLPVKQGIDGIPVKNIPDSPAAFVSWFKTSFLPRWAALADIRNATSGAGIQISGNIATPATVSVNSQVQSLFAQPYVLVGSPVAPAPLTDYRSIAAQASVLTLTDGGAESTITVGVAANGIGNAQIRQGAAASVIGNAASIAGNVADIAASADGQVLQSAGGGLSFAALSLTSIAAIANNTVLGNISGGSAAPSAVALTSLAANPTSQVSLAAHNGSAITFMRSDAAPPLDVTIAPSWSGLHTYGNGIVISTPSSATTNLTVAGGAGATFTAGQCATFNGAAHATYPVVINGSGTAGNSNGLCIAAGTNSSDVAFIVANAGGTNRFEVDGAGSVTVGAAPSGGGQGIGTINVASKYYVNGVAQPVFAAAQAGYGTPVATITANQSSGSTLAVTAGNLAAIMLILKTAGLIAA